jgi:hypothetical protein
MQAARPPEPRGEVVALRAPRDCAPVRMAPEARASAALIVEALNDPQPAERKESAHHPLDRTRYRSPLVLPSPDGAHDRNKPKYRIADLIAEAAELGGVTVADLKGQSRLWQYVRPRQFAMWRIATCMPHKSLPEIGRQLGGRDHTTALHAIRKVRRLIVEGVIDPDNPQAWMQHTGAL